MKDQIKAGKLKRRELFITTKVPAVYLALKDIKPSVESSLEKLKLNFVDMVLIHYPFGLKNLGDGTLYPLDEKGQRLYENYNLHDSWRGLEQTVNAGLVRSIGLSNFTPSQIQNICKHCFIKPANLQLECHAYLQQKELRKMCYSLGIVLSAYGPLGNPGRPESYRKSDEIEEELINDKTVASVAKANNKTVGQILLKFLMQQGMAVLPKTSSKQRLEENIGLYGWDLDAFDMQKLRDLDRGLKYFRFDWAKNHPQYSLNEPF